MRIMTVFVLTGALLCTATSATALEVTSHNDIRKLNSGLEQRLESTSAALTAAFNNLKDTIDDILARLGVLETKMAAVTTKQPADWNTPLENRLLGIESTNAAQTNAINTSTTKNNAQDNRLAALENQTPAAIRIRVKSSGCSDISVVRGSQRMCPSNRVLVGVTGGVIATSSKSWSGTFHCCELETY